MNCFQLIKSVLDEEYAQIPGTEAEKDKMIVKALTSLREHYAQVTLHGPGDYSDRVTRFSYIFNYVTSHANLVFDLIRQTKQLRELFDQGSVQVACLGGGPGSDFLGILKYLQYAEKAPRVRCLLFDREQAWAESWTDVDEKIEPAFPLSVQFLAIDVTEPKSWAPHTKYFNSDLFTLIYFCSEVSKQRAIAEPYFTKVFQSAKKGALFLFVDNNASAHYGWFDELAKHNGVDINTSEECILCMPTAEEKRDLGRYYKKCGAPKLKANVAWRLGLKA